MSDFMIGFMFFSLVLIPCIVARAICISHDRAALIIVPPEPQFWD